MKAPKVRLYVRVTLADGSHPFLDPVYAANHKLRPGFAVVGGKPQHFDDVVYYLRCAGKWNPIGTDPQEALRLLLQRQGRAMTEAAAAPEQPGSVPCPEPRPEKLVDCMRVYVAETGQQKCANTLKLYSNSLRQFLQCLNERAGVAPPRNVDDEPTLEEYLDPENSPLSSALRSKPIRSLTREDVLSFMLWLRQRRVHGRAVQDRTVYNHILNLNIFLHQFDVPTLLKRKDKPRFTRKKVRAYNEAELAKMFRVATVDEADRLHFLLSTGTRRTEAVFACWPDVDMERKTYTITEHPEYGFKPKDKEEGTIPIPDLLIERLRARHLRYPGTRLIFSGPGGKPEDRSLAIIKRLALKGGANCGCCVNRQGQSCATRPICKAIILHKLRKTYASWLHRKGVPAKKIMVFLRHSDLATTMLYLADEEDDQTITQVNQAFSDSLAQAGGTA